MAAPLPLSGADVAWPTGTFVALRGLVVRDTGLELWRRVKEKIVSWQERDEDVLRRKLREANRFFLEAAGASAAMARAAWICPSPSLGAWAFPEQLAAGIPVTRPVLLQKCMLSLSECWAGRADRGLQEKFADVSLVTASPVIVVLTIMGIVYFSYVGVLVPTAGLRLGSWSSLAFHSAFFLGMASFYQGIVVDPGGIPESWAGDPERLPNFAQQFEPWERKKKTGQLRYCNKEMKFKPDRAHFCSMEKRNILRMDHYCPWLSNCVGFGNHKFFYLFLLYTMVIVGMGDVGFARALHGRCASAAHTFSMGQGLLLTSTLTCILLPFFAFHTWMLTKNMTTIEFCSLRMESGPFHSPFDVGVWENLQSVLGTEWYLWPFPVGAPPGDGLIWKVNEQARRERSRCSSIPPMDRASSAQQELELAMELQLPGSAGVLDASALRLPHLGVGGVPRGTYGDAEDTDGDTYKCFLRKEAAAVKEDAAVKAPQQDLGPALTEEAAPALAAPEEEDPPALAASNSLDGGSRQLHEDPQTLVAATGLEGVSRQLHALMDRLPLEDITGPVMSMAEGVPGNVAAVAKDLAEKLRPATENLAEVWTSTSTWRQQLLSTTRDIGHRWLSPAPAPALVRITTTVHEAARNADLAAQSADVGRGEGDGPEGPRSEGLEPQDQRS